MFNMKIKKILACCLFFVSFGAYAQESNIDANKAISIFKNAENIAICIAASLYQEKLYKESGNDSLADGAKSASTVYVKISAALIEKNKINIEDLKAAIGREIKSNMQITEIQAKTKSRSCLEMLINLLS
jgi:hypothetical protein